MKFSLAFSVSSLVVLSVLAVEKYLDKEIKFDSQLNCYAVLFHDKYSNNDRLYKFNKKNEIVFNRDFKNIWKILINKEDEVYVFSSDFFDHAQGKQSVWRLKPGSDNLDFLFKFDSKGKYKDPSYFVDQDGHVFFNTRSGVAVLKFHENEPVWIVNLEKFVFDDHWEDKDGSIFLKNNNSVANITKDSKQSLIVLGTIVRNDGGIKTLSDKPCCEEKEDSESGLNKWEIFGIAWASIFCFFSLVHVLIWIFKKYSLSPFGAIVSPFHGKVNKWSQLIRQIRSDRSDRTRRNLQQ